MKQERKNTLKKQIAPHRCVLTFSEEGVKKEPLGSIGTSCLEEWRHRPVWKELAFPPVQGFSMGRCLVNMCSVKRMKYPLEELGHYFCFRINNMLPRSTDTKRMFRVSAAGLDPTTTFVSRAIVMGSLSCSPHKTPFLLFALMSDCIWSAMYV